MEYMVERVGVKAESIKSYAKDNCYRALVDHLQDTILDVIKRDVKANEVGPSPRAMLTGITD